jgi:hypothetical protein
MSVHAIFDLETLGLREELERGQLPEIVEIGVVFFDSDTFEQVDSRLWYPEVGNGAMSYGTVAWWIKQILETGKAPAWYVWRAGGNTHLVDRVLDDIVVAFSNWKPVKVWGNDPEMDLTPIEEWFKCKGRNVPWKFYQRMDVRTGVRPEKSATHDSVEDCVREVAILKMKEPQKAQKAQNAAAWSGVRPEKSATHDSVEDCVREVAILKMANGGVEPQKAQKAQNAQDDQVSESGQSAC